ncbi:hypothetical protein [Turicibacter sanguinis]|uniref:hypothetical protein n=1 Tax=Turicibacter sanguinis TaxID=154288 RepID=UPI0018AB2174|nr:hypothetical protein [Turicibacter sanguinis]MDB8553249.1 hypothetical protein [Turicibacter sanguinis]
MSDSVGKISLDLEVKSDINQQVADISGRIGKSLKSSLDGGLKSAFEGINNSTKGSMNNLSRVIDKSMSGMSNGLKKRLSSIFSSFQQIKAPTVQFPQPQNTPMPQMSIPQAQPVRGPPQINTEAIRTQIDTLGRTLDNTNARIEQQNTKLKLLREQYSATFNQNRKNKLSEQILKAEANINRLTATSDKLGFKLSDLDSKLSQTSGASSKVSNGMNNINQATKKATTSARLFGDRVKKNTQQMGSYRSGIGMMVRSMITWGMVFPMIIRGLSALGTYIGQSFMTNQQFANSLTQIKTNLMVAFTPIFQAVLPALNALMFALATATTYIASFISAIFGKTYQQSYQATQGLIDAKTAMGAYGDSASDTAKKVKGALAGFDEINVLNTQDDANSTAGSGGSGAPTLVQPSIDTSLIDSQTKSIVDKINEFFNGIDFIPLKNSFIELKAAIAPIIENIGKIISWFMENILQPLSEWVIEDALPAFFNVLAGVFKVLNPLLEVFMDLGSWLWESFLEPIAAWTGGVIVSVLNGLADTLSSIGTWMSENKPIVEAFVIIIGSFALAWGLVSAALAIVSAVTGIWAAAATIGTVATTLFGAAIAFLTSPITIAILAIGAIIAAAILLWRNWDEVSAWLIEIWETIKTKALEIWTRIKDFLSETWEKIKNTCSEVWTKVKEFFISTWNSIKETANNVWNSILNTCKTIFDNLKNYMSDIWNGIKQIFSGVIDFVVGVFTGDWERAWEGVKSVFKGIFDTFGSIVKTPLNAVIKMINTCINGLNKIKFSIPNWVPGIGGNSYGISIPNIPMLAKGGILDSPTLAMVGEAGKEAVVPLENNTQGLDLLAAKLLERMPASSSNSGDDSPVEVVLQIGDTQLGRVVINSINKLQRQSGRMLLDVDL